MTYRLAESWTFNMSNLFASRYVRISEHPAIASTVSKVHVFGAGRAHKARSRRPRSLGMARPVALDRTGPHYRRRLDPHRRDRDFAGHDGVGRPRAGARRPTDRRRLSRRDRYGKGLPESISAALTEAIVADSKDPSRDLGIRVVRDLVRGLGGRIVPTTPSGDHGSCIIVRLPLGTSDEETIQR